VRGIARRLYAQQYIPVRIAATFNNFNAKRFKSAGVAIPIWQLIQPVKAYLPVASSPIVRVVGALHVTVVNDKDRNANRTIVAQYIRPSALQSKNHNRVEVFYVAR